MEFEMVENVAPQKFLVTGACGFIGSYLMQSLISRYGPGSVTAMVPVKGNPREEDVQRDWAALGVTIIRADLLNLAATQLSVPNFDVVYHLAGFAETEMRNGPFRVNDRGTMNLVQWLGDSLRGKRFIFTGTLASVDKGMAKGPVDETTPCSPLSLYGKTKLRAEEFIRELAHSFHFDYTILRLCTIVGKGFRKGGMFGVFPNLLKRNAIATRLNWPGRASFLYVEDLVRILVTLPFLGQTENQTYVISNGEEITFDEVLTLTASVLGLKRHRIVLPKWLWSIIAQAAWAGARCPFLPYRLRNSCWRVAHLTSDGILADASLLNSLLGFKYMSFEEALHKSYRPVTGEIQPL
jgi:nucleoside-diphosphate-sugar epimerase